MSFSHEALLMLLALGLYVSDALLLLDSDELVLVQARRGSWRPAFGAHGWMLRQREPMLPNLLMPWRAQSRLRWRFESGLGGTPTPGGPQMPTVSLLPRIGVGVLGVLIFAALPLCLFVWPDLVLTLLVVGAIYGCAGLVLIALRGDARRLGVDRKIYLKLCVECISCPPFCINAVRRLSLLAPTKVRLADVSTWLEPASEQDALKRQIARRLRDQIDLEPENSARAARLHAALRELNLEEEFA